jgi:hypothetical protein
LQEIQAFLFFICNPKSIYENVTLQRFCLPFSGDELHEMFYW